MAENYKPLVEAYKSLADSEIPDGVDDEYFRVSCDDVESAILGFLYEFAPRAYFDCVQHYVMQCERQA